MSADQYTINGLGMGQGTLSSLQDRNSVPVTIKMGPSPTDNDPGRYAITLRYLDIDFDEATYVTDS
ncbi:hypothetical protein ACE4ZV_27005, partial [Salmonella enterica]|uniref:hypothetical protein n=1 Tax=Salmonella enterica TaxID=28901 RepID=UPI003D2B9C9A